MKNGFTLIELLAVIVILSIIAVIAVPIILNIIENTKEKAFEQTINGIIKSATLKASMELKTEEILYKYENNNWIENKLNIDGEIPKYIEIKVNKKGQTRYAITNGVYSFIKNEYEGKVEIKKIGNKNNNKQIQEEYCKLDTVIPTDESCFSYKESNNSITITSYSCYKGNKEGKPVITNLVIPEKINGKKVTSLGFGAFDSKGLTSVIIPNTIIEINTQAFYNNKLTNIVIPDSITSLGVNAFRRNNLDTLIIPSNVVGIGSGAFAQNLLTSIEIQNSVKSIGYGAFIENQLPDNNAFIYNRKSDGSIDYTSLNSYGGKNRENLIIPEGVKYIGEYACSVNGVKNVTIPEGVTTIDSRAFKGCKIHNITIPNSVIYIGEWAFSFNELTSITIPVSVMKIGNNAFYNDSFSLFLTQVTIKGKSSISDFEYFGTNVFSWKEGYSDSNITWEGSS